MYNFANEGGGIYCKGSEYGPSSPVIINNIITGNSAGYTGGGIFCDSSFAIITNNVITGNWGHWGGGITCLNHSSPTIQNNIVEGNFAAGNTGGVYCQDSHITLIGNVIKGNLGDGGIGGIGCLDSSATIMNNLIVGNHSGDDFGGGIRSIRSTLTITNNTIAGNSRDGINALGYVEVINCIVRGQAPISEGLTVAYSNVEGGYEGAGNIDDDPCFADGYYHLKSQAGRWDADKGQWTKDDVTSPCIDAGHPYSDWTAELWPHGNRINMGAYGGTPQASMSRKDLGNIADLNNDDFVDYNDMKLFTAEWLNQQVLLKEDLDRNGFVDLADFAIFADNWLWP